MNSSKQRSYRFVIVVCVWIGFLTGVLSIMSLTWTQVKKHRQHDNINYIREQILKRKYPGYSPINFYRLEENNKVNS